METELYIRPHRHATRRGIPSSGRFQSITVSRGTANNTNATTQVLRATPALITRRQLILIIPIAIISLHHYIYYTTRNITSNTNTTNTTNTITLTTNTIT